MINFYMIYTGSSTLTYGSLIARVIDDQSSSVERTHHARQYAYWYSRYVGFRWPKIEPLMLSVSAFAYCYARYIICGRWPEAEPILRTSPYWGYYTESIKKTFTT
jgi:hypothetical protein